MKKLFGTSIIAIILSANLAMAQTLPTEPNPAARALVKIDALASEMQALTNRIEVLESELSKQKEENLRLAKLIDDANSKTIAKNELQTGPTPDEIAKAQAAAISEIERQQNTQPKTEAINLPKEAPTPPAPKTSEVLMREAQVLMQNGDYYNAELKLTELTEKHAGSKEYEDALWFLGETRFVQKAFAPSAQAYIAYLSKAPNGPRVTDSLVQLASSFRELGDNRQRCVALAEYNKRSNGASAALKARANIEIAKGKCP